MRRATRRSSPRLRPARRSLTLIDEGVAPGLAEHLEVPLDLLRKEVRRRIFEE